jgi:hypothetical protein
VSIALGLVVTARCVVQSLVVDSALAVHFRSAP